MKRFFFSTLLASTFLILSACQQNAEQVSTATPIAEFATSPTKTATITPSPTLSNTKTPTLVPIPIVDFSQAIPPTLAPGILQGKIILNRDYSNFLVDNHSDEDKTAILFLNNYSKEYFDELTGYYSYHWSSGTGFQNANYSPTYENFVWSHDGKFLAFPVMERGVQLFILNTEYLNKDIDEGLQKITLSPYHTEQPYPHGTVYKITWSPDNQHVIIHMYSGYYANTTYCLVNIQTEEIQCDLFSWWPFSSEEREFFSHAQSMAWSPFDENKTTFISNENTESHKAGLYILDIETSEIKLLQQILPTQKYLWKRFPLPPYPTSPFWYDNGERIAFFPQKNSLASVDTNGQNYQLLFNNRILYQKIAGLVPEEFQKTLPNIYSPTLSPDGKYIIFEVHWYADKQKSTDLLRGIFLFEIETKEIFLLQDFMSRPRMSLPGPFLRPSWAP